MGEGHVDLLSKLFCCAVSSPEVHPEVYPEEEIPEVYPEEEIPEVYPEVYPVEEIPEGNGLLELCNYTTYVYYTMHIFQVQN